MTVAVAAPTAVVLIDVARGRTRTVRPVEGMRPTSLVADPTTAGGLWLGTRAHGVWRSDDGGESWHYAGLEGVEVMSLSAGSDGSLLVGTEPSEIWRTDDHGATWRASEGLEHLPSSDEWAFPPRPDTHHVRWLARRPGDPDRVWAAIEAGALIRSSDGGRHWRDRTEGGPHDTHELAIHAALPDVLRVAAGDGYYESHDGGLTWSTPRLGLEVGYLRSVAIDPGDPEGVVVSASSSPRTAYAAGRGDGRLFRRAGPERWTRITDGWPDPPTTIAPLLAPGREAGELWAADERGLHRSTDGGRRWGRVASFDPTPDHLRALVVAA